jgi:hypothetical protein
MGQSSIVVGIGASCFGVVVGYITYRTLLQTQKTQVTDLSAVVAAIGGGAIAGRFEDGESFAWYSMGLLTGMAIFLIVHNTLGQRPSVPVNGQRGQRLGEETSRDGVLKRRASILAE